jgi:hypothetical protein
MNFLTLVGSMLVYIALMYIENGSPKQASTKRASKDDKWLWQPTWQTSNLAFKLVIKSLVNMAHDPQGAFGTSWCEISLFRGYRENESLSLCARLPYGSDLAAQNWALPWTREGRNWELCGVFLGIYSICL